MSVNRVRANIRFQPRFVSAAALLFGRAFAALLNGKAVAIKLALQRCSIRD